MSIAEVSALGTNVLADIATLLVGDKISDGSARSVYQCKLRPDLVVKIENVARSFQNIEEFNTWEMVRDTDYAKWFAEIALPEANAPRRKPEIPSGLAITPDGSKLFVCGNLSNRLLELDPRLARRL